MKNILGIFTTKYSTLPAKITVNKTDIFDAKKKKKKLMNSIIFLKIL